MKKGIIAEISLEGDRLFLIHKRNGRETSSVDVTGVWHFLKEVYNHRSVCSSECSVDCVPDESGHLARCPKFKPLKAEKVYCAGCKDCLSSDAPTGEDCVKMYHCVCHKPLHPFKQAIKDSLNREIGPTP